MEQPGELNAARRAVERGAVAGMAHDGEVSGRDVSTVLSASCVTQPKSVSGTKPGEQNMHGQSAGQVGGQPGAWSGHSPWFSGFDGMQHE